jgi:protein farnesyltransferase/geranylgeranyltransferase type-1 subunit alpha
MFAYLRLIQTALLQVGGEKAFISLMLEDDAKNYHAWAYRQWVVETYGLWNGELAFTEQLMSEVIQMHACASQPNLDMLTSFKLN